MLISAKNIFEFQQYKKIGWSEILTLLLNIKTYYFVKIQTSEAREKKLWNTLNFFSINNNLLDTFYSIFEVLVGMLKILWVLITK